VVNDLKQTKEALPPFTIFKQRSAQGSITNAANDTYTLILDYRNAPPITTTNALIGHSAFQQSHPRFKWLVLYSPLKNGDA